MGPIEITIIVICVLIVGLVAGSYIYKKIKGLPTGDCGCCHDSKKGNKILKAYRKKYGEKNSSCHCGCCNHDIGNDNKDHQCDCDKNNK